MLTHGIFSAHRPPPLSLEDLIGAVVQAAADDAPLTRLRTAASMTQVVNDVTDAGLGYFVDQARRAGHSWSEIGEALGVSKQAAQQRQRNRTVTLTMPVTFERFTERARNVLSSSKSIAQELGHDYVGTEHLLLAQYSEPEGLGAQLLSESGLPARAARKAVLQAVPKGAGAPDGRLAFTPTAIESLTAALTIALEHKHNYIGTEHLLLGVARTEGVASRILVRAGMDEAVAQQEARLQAGAVLAARAVNRPTSQSASPVNPAPPGKAPPGQGRAEPNERLRPRSPQRPA